MSIDTSKSVLYVAYPLLPVSDESCGGAEQILWSLESEIASRGRQTAVAAAESSRVRGELLATGPSPDVEDAFDTREQQHSDKIVNHCASRHYSLVHDHSGHFWRHASRINAPVLATLHLPRTFYSETLFRAIP